MMPLLLVVSTAGAPVMDGSLVQRLQSWGAESRCGGSSLRAASMPHCQRSHQLQACLCELALV